jgi:hypothetical protein
MTNSRFFFLNSSIQETYLTLLGGIQEHKGFLLLTGEAGIGKTTLLRRLTNDLGEAVLNVYFDPSPSLALTFDGLLDFLCRELQICPSELGRLQKLQTLTAYLMARAEAGQTTALFIDTAERLDDEVLGQLRFLMPINPRTEKPLLQILLAGRPELEQRLDQPKLRPLKQRIALYCCLPRFDEQDVRLVPISMTTSERPAWRRVLPVSISLILLIVIGISYWLSSRPPLPVFVLTPPLASAPKQPPVNSEPIPTPSDRKSTPSISVVSEQLSDNGESTQDTTEPKEAELTQDAIAPKEKELNKENVVAILQPQSPSFTITKAKPLTSTVRLMEGKPITFMVEVTSAQADQLQYLWLLDGQEQKRGPQWTYQPQLGESGKKQKEVAVRIIDPNNYTIERKWRVRVHNVNRPPTITAVFPSQPTLELAAGTSQRFAIEATDPDADDQLKFAWFLDGHEVSREQEWYFPMSDTSEQQKRHQVEATVSDRGRLKSRTAWYVIVAKSSPLPPPIEPAMPDNKRELPHSSDVASETHLRLNEGEVRAWLEAHQQAWEKRDVSTLVRLGVVPQQQADRVRKMLSEYNSFHVALQQVNIRLQGDHAEVSFSRVDTVDGRTIPHPGRKVFRLDRKADGQLSALLEIPKPSSRDYPDETSPITSLLGQ